MEATSAQRKLAWAIRHLKRLRDEVDAYMKSNAYEFRADPERRSPQQIDFRCYATERQAPDPDWPMIAGDAIQNLRAALDHLVWAATPDAKRTPSTEFPIFVDASKFFDDAGNVRRSVARKYRHVGAAMQGTIEQAQPFAHTSDDPSWDPLAILYDLSILDKHRTMVAVAGGVHMEGVGSTHPAEITWTDTGTGRTLGSGETYVSSVQATTTDPQIDAAEVEFFFEFQVLIDGRTVDTLVGIARRVFQVVYECEVGSPVPITAPYPI